MEKFGSGINIPDLQPWILMFPFNALNTSLNPFSYVPILTDNYEKAENKINAKNIRIFKPSIKL
jgi:hypothetical protein